MKTKVETTIKDELIAIQAANPDGLLMPAAVVAFARENPDSALHGRFTWDDSAAAEAWRLHEARQIIRVNVIILSTEPITFNANVTVVPTRRWVSLPSDRLENGGYRDIETVARDEEMLRELQVEAIMQLRHWQNRYRHLKRLGAIMAVIDEALGDSDDSSKPQPPAPPPVG